MADKLPSVPPRPSLPTDDPIPDGTDEEDPYEHPEFNPAYDTLPGETDAVNGYDNYLHGQQQESGYARAPRDHTTDNADNADNGEGDDGTNHPYAEVDGEEEGSYEQVPPADHDDEGSYERVSPADESDQNDNDDNAPYEDVDDLETPYADIDGEEAPYEDIDGSNADNSNADKSVTSTLGLPPGMRAQFNALLASHSDADNPDADNSSDLADADAEPCYADALDLGLMGAGRGLDGIAQEQQLAEEDAVFGALADSQAASRRSSMQPSSGDTSGAASHRESIGLVPTYVVDAAQVAQLSASTDHGSEQRHSSNPSATLPPLSHAKPPRRPAPYQLSKNSNPSSAGMPISPLTTPPSARTGSANSMANRKSTSASSLANQVQSKATTLGSRPSPRRSADNSPHADNYRAQLPSTSSQSSTEALSPGISTMYKAMTLTRRMGFQDGQQHPVRHHVTYDGGDKPPLSHRQTLVSQSSSVSSDGSPVPEGIQAMVRAMTMSKGQVVRRPPTNAVTGGNVRAVGNPKVAGNSRPVSMAGAKARTLVLDRPASSRPKSMVLDAHIRVDAAGVTRAATLAPSGGRSDSGRGKEARGAQGGVGPMRAFVLPSEPSKGDRLRHTIRSTLNAQHTQASYQHRQPAAALVQQKVDTSLLSVLTSEAKQCHFLVKMAVTSSKLKDDHAALMAGVLACHPTLVQCDLSHNSIGNEGATRIAAAITTSPRLASLDLSHNRIKDPGCHELHEAAFSPRKGSTCILSLLNLVSNPISKKLKTHLLTFSSSDCDVRV
eukprot:TRINITY_DN10116_c0_g2_i3.p1 TRINITY_DN10116_c0_g2~~TRINITY_DN10116_c0_g2_i3.p1  ORF type:complete len:781 (+),score=171.78 TRINITY_DN10116_c0_g2_i3:222-2564(+)